ncbi:MAG: PilZ domain-containing protein [Eubacteriales bacterium]
MSLEGISNLNLNVNVTIFSPDKNANDLSSNIYKGRIYSRELDQSVVIELEGNDGSGSLTVGKPILLFLAHDLGLYIFSATISLKNSKDRVTFLHCKNPQQVKYFQRRTSVRVQVAIPVSFSAELNRSRVWDGTITNMSIGGLQMEAPF